MDATSHAGRERAVDNVRSLSMARLGFGLAALVAPRAMARTLLGREAMAGAPLLGRMWAAREVAVGMMTLHALEEPAKSRRVVELNALVDGLDAVAAVLGWRHIPGRTRFMTIAGGLAAAATSVALVRQLD